ncbi:MAG: hypothetical protein U9R75_12005 [Candidatus Thermoplasmatota archaeon]|nr:hypothetical protein [Candidatus Thermoplasmatota archaeon]
MENVKIDRRIGIVLLLLIVLMVLNNVAGFVIYPAMRNGNWDLSEFFMREYYISLGIFFLGFLSRIVIAVWLNMEAKRFGRSRLIWTVFGLIFGLIAAILFYIIEIYNEIVLLRKNVKRIGK